MEFLQKVKPDYIHVVQDDDNYNDTTTASASSSKKKGVRTTTISSNYDMEIVVKHVKRAWLPHYNMESTTRESETYLLQAHYSGERYYHWPDYCLRLEDTTKQECSLRQEGEKPTTLSMAATTIFLRVEGLSLQQWHREGGVKLQAASLLQAPLPYSREDKNYNGHLFRAVWVCRSSVTLDFFQFFIFWGCTPERAPNPRTLSELNRISWVCHMRTTCQNYLIFLCVSHHVFHVVLFLGWAHSQAPPGTHWKMGLVVAS